MSHPLESYAIVGDTETVALVCATGAIDWLCMPRFDSPASFAALLGDDSNGTWRIHPSAEVTSTDRRYRDHTLILETDLGTDDGAIRIIDFMPPRGTQRGDNPDLVRIVTGLEGRVEVEVDLVIRFDYGSIVPWVTRTDGGLHAVAGPDALTLTTPVETRGEGMHTKATLTVEEGDEIPFVLTWHPSHQDPPEPVDPFQSLEDTQEWWEEWSERSTYDLDYAEEVEDSLLILKAMTYRPTGAIVAAPTTSLPEKIGGVRNWDYRYVWLRDATFALYAMMLGGYQQEAEAWRDWLLRAVAGDPSQLQIMYGIGGEHRLPEVELDWLSGYEDSTPVRVGNAASDQVQLDVYGEVIDALHLARQGGMEPTEQAWEMQLAWLDHLESAWKEPDNGIWEVRGDRAHFTYSKMMAWVAFDRAVKTVEESGLHGPVDTWRRQRDDLREQILEEGYNDERGAFTMCYGNDHLDASLLLIPQVGLLDPEDERFVSTVETIGEELTDGGVLVHRYDADEVDDGLPGGEGAFLLCSFWYADALGMIGREDEARRGFEQLLDHRNDVGLLPEEIDPDSGRFLGNFPQAFSHIGLINSAVNMSGGEGPAFRRGRGP
ncbi:MAG: glycoside hydrolase family 15 protein [Nitriliruptorales bacterium]|nr:glycoside hydrolase family 15 protein [Nitriliruptorales bacterium]